MPTEDDKIIDLPTDGPGAEVILPEGFSLEQNVVLKGAYALLSKMNNSEEEGHSH